MKALMISALVFSSSFAFAGVNNILCQSEKAPSVNEDRLIVGQIVNPNLLVLSVRTYDRTPTGGFQRIEFLDQAFKFKSFSKDNRFAIYTGGGANEMNYNMALIVAKEAILAPGTNYRAIFKWTSAGGDVNYNHAEYMTCLRK